MTMERAEQPVVPPALSGELSAPVPVIVERRQRRAGKSGASVERGPRHEARAEKRAGRPPSRWRIRVVRIEAARPPEFTRERPHPFAAMAPPARVAEIDSFCARLWARTNKKAA
jgi:hypothetical protein